MKRVFLSSVFLPFLCSTALAQGDIATDELEKKAMGEAKKDDKKKEDPDGWKVSGKLGFSGSLTDAQNFVGAEEGLTVQLGVVLGVDANWKSGQHGWENRLQAQHAQTKTPAIDAFVKSADQLDLKSTYLYRFKNPEWVGVFGRFKLNTQLLRGYSVQAKPAEYSVNGTLVATRQAGQRFSVTGPFEPLTLRESAGAFVKPIKEDYLEFKSSLGIAAQHVIVREGRVVDSVDDSGATALIALLELDDQNDFGIELTADAKGAIVKDILSWKLSIDLFQPVLPSAGDGEPSGIDRLNMDLIGGLSLKLAKWASVDYVLTVRRQPVVLQEWQVQNQVLLTAGFDIL